MGLVNRAWRMLIVASFEPILTERLLIRKLEIGDAQAFFKYRSLPQIYEYQSFQPKNEEDVKLFFEAIAEMPNIQNTWFQLAVCLKETNHMIGDIGIHFLNDDTQTEIGYTIDPDYQGKGYARESVLAVTNYLFTVLQKQRVTASVDPDNKKSIRLLESIGMINDVWKDDCIQ
jgi:RimJ/RimL family protein N-acetyltransferase